MIDKIFHQEDYKNKLEALKPGEILVQKLGGGLVTVTIVCPDCGITVSSTWTESMIEALSDLVFRGNSISHGEL